MIASPMDAVLRDLVGRLREVHDLRAAAAVLEWDQATYMPPGGADARGRQLGTLQKLAHEKLADDAVGKLIEQLEPWASGQPRASFGASIVRAARRDFDRAAKVPPAFTAKMADHFAASYTTWTQARPANDFARVRPYLERTVELSLEYGSFFPGSEHPADPLIDWNDPGMTMRSVRALFDALRVELVPLVEAICARPAADDRCLRGHFPRDVQAAFGRAVVTQLGYDFGRGRLDETHHPFMTRFALGDVRITTRYNQEDFGDALFATIHEAGHALYEQGTGAELDGTPLGEGASAGLHEAQSRLWENLVGRSRAFWTCFFPKLQSAFPAALSEVSLETFYRAINKVERSPIRVEADEVTYNLHVMIRVELERQLLEGELAVKDLPEAWNARYRSDLGITPSSDAMGVMQDVHWYGGSIGGSFQGYTLGNVISAQLFEAAVRARPQIPEQIAKGDFAPLREWLVENVYRYGRSLPPADVVEQATGRPPTIEPYVAYLKKKFGELHGL